VTTSATITFTVDNTPPTASVTAPTAGQCVKNPVTISYTVADNLPGDLKKVEVLIDDVVRETLSPATQGAHTSGPYTLSQGNHTVKVRATDNCDNVTTSATITFTVDETPPTATVTAPTSGQCVKSPVTISFNVTDNLPGDLQKCEILIDGVVKETKAPCPQGNGTSGPHTLSDGTHTVQIRATDACGNVGSSAVVTFVVDNTPPTVTIFFPGPGDCVKSPVTFTFFVSDNLPGDLKKCELFIDGVSRDVKSPCPQGERTAGPFTLSDGTHKVKVTVTDNCDNATTSTEVTFIVDGTPPAVSITAPGNGDCLKSSAVTINYTATDNLPGDLKICEVLVDGSVVKTESPCTQGAHTAGPFNLSDGTHVLKVRATDNCNNVGQSTDVTITVDTQGPVINLPTIDCVNGPITFSYSVTDNLPGNIQMIRLFVDDVLKDTKINVPQGDQSSGPYDIPDGSHTVKIEATDACGNQTVTTQSFKVDKTQPECTITKPVDGDLIGGSVTVEYLATDNLPGNLKKIELFIDNVSFGVKTNVPQGAGSFGPLGLGGGPHCVTIVVTDSCGNQHTCGPVCFSVAFGDCGGIPLPNLICGPTVIDPFDGQPKQIFRPEELNIDGYTPRDVLNYNHVTIDENLIIQAVCVRKETPVIKCTAFTNGPGSGANTNFDSGLKFATITDLDRPICNVAFGMPLDEECLGCRCLLFSPPCTTYTICVVYVVRDPVTGRTGPPITKQIAWSVETPSKDKIKCNIDYFSTVAAGTTQKPKITEDVATALKFALDNPNDLEALIAFETIVANSAIDFVSLITPQDARFKHSYLIDSDEEPIGCLLIEQANALLFHP